jgi:hypothetical protein
MQLTHHTPFVPQSVPPNIVPQSVPPNIVPQSVPPNLEVDFNLPITLESPFRIELDFLASFP